MVELTQFSQRDTKMNVRSFSTLLGILLATLVSGCASLPNTTTEKIRDRNVEFALTKHDTIPIVFENGLGGRMEYWNKVIPKISSDTTTFLYNRPGYGRSDEVSTPRDGTHVVDELRSLLQSKGLNPPYLLVGHSLGGLYMQLFARRYPNQVSALILVDSTHPEQFKGKGAPDNWPSWFKVAFSLWTSKVEKDEMEYINQTGEAVLSLPSFTEKPVIILSASQPMKNKSELADYANDKRKDFMRLYPGSKQVWVDSGHAIPLEEPESVASAIREVLMSIEPNK